MKSDDTLLILTPGFAASEEDAALTYLQDFVLSYKNCFPQLRIKIITLQYPFKAGIYNWKDIEIYSAGGRNSKLLRGLTWLKAWTELRKEYRTNNVIAIQSFWLTECAWLGELFSKFSGIKHFACIMGQDAKPGNRYLRLLPLQRMKIIAISHALADRLFQSFRIPVQHVIPLGLIPAKFDIPAEERDIDIIGVGSLIPLKNYELFTTLIAELYPAFPLIKAVIVGDGPEKKKIAVLIREKEMEEACILAGSLSHEKTIAMMKRSRILLHTSEYEGQSMVMMEALAAGLTVISFDLGNTFLYSGRRKIKAENRAEMLDILKELLHRNEWDHQPVFVQTMDDTVKEFAALHQL